MDFEYTESEQNFREEVKSFLAENLPPKKAVSYTHLTLPTIYSV